MATYLKDAEEYVAKEKFKKAAKAYRKLAKRVPDTMSKASFFLKEADCIFEAGKTQYAAELYQKLMQEYPLYIPYQHVVERLRILAERYVDGNGTFWGIRDSSQAIKLYYLIIQEAPALNVSLQDRERLAELLIQNDRAEEAVAVYQEILKQNPALDDVRLKLALLFINLSKSGDGDGSKVRAAIRHAEMILKRNPSYERKDEVRQLIEEATESQANQLLETAKFYLVKSHFKADAARYYLQDVLSRFPYSHAALEAKNILVSHPALNTPEPPKQDENK
ncbi:MAG: tetratricopeptide repeat protein [Victivallales bacterium]|nr:tetratricopeptide repeat protein [Victivallales bacterium]